MSTAPVDARSTHPDPRISAARAQIESMLVPGEIIEAMAVQHRLFALLQRRIVVAATSGRLISISRGLIAGFKPLDIRWQDLKDASVHVGMFGTRLTLHVTGAIPSASRAVIFEGLEKDGAQQIYRICEAQEQAWREKRRIRELEEMRAKAGGVSIGPHGFQSQETSASAPADDPATRLEKAKAMFDKGLITDAEFETIKAKVINSL